MSLWVEVLDWLLLAAMFAFVAASVVHLRRHDLAFATYALVWAVLLTITREHL